LAVELTSTYLPFRDRNCLAGRFTAAKLTSLVNANGMLRHPCARAQSRRHDKRVSIPREHPRQVSDDLPIPQLRRLHLPPIHANGGLCIDVGIALLGVGLTVKLIRPRCVLSVSIGPFDMAAHAHAVSGRLVGAGFTLGRRAWIVLRFATFNIQVPLTASASACANAEPGITMLSNAPGGSNAAERANLIHDFIITPYLL
jgi:hypothetical protein